MGKAHEMFIYTTPDTVAECWNGVLDNAATDVDAKWSLYKALWAAMDDMKPISEQIDMEESGPGDAVGLNTVASVWDRFTEAQQDRLNELARANDGKAVS